MRWLDGITDSMGFEQMRNLKQEFEQILGDSEGQGSLVCCSPWGRRVTHDSATKQQLLMNFAAKTFICAVNLALKYTLFMECSRCRVPQEAPTGFQLSRILRKR